MYSIHRRIDQYSEEEKQNRPNPQAARQKAEATVAPARLPHLPLSVRDVTRLSRATYLSKLGSHMSIPKYTAFILRRHNEQR